MIYIDPKSFFIQLNMIQFTQKKDGIYEKISFISNSSMFWHCFPVICVWQLEKWRFWAPGCILQPIRSLFMIWTHRLLNSCLFPIQLMNMTILFLCHWKAFHLKYGRLSAEYHGTWCTDRPKYRKHPGRTFCYGNRQQKAATVVTLWRSEPMTGVTTAIHNCLLIRSQD